MSRILLVDDSPHAQRLGERILTDEGYEVVTVSNADSALIRLDDVDPDVVLADAVMPGRTGYEICQYLKMSPRHRHVRVILTAGALEAFDDERVRLVEADGALRKPFEASALLAAVKPLAEAAARRREDSQPGPGAAERLAAAAPFVAVVDSEQVRAAVTVALDAAMETMVGEITGRVLAAMRAGKSAQPAVATALQEQTQTTKDDRPRRVTAEPEPAPAPPAAVPRAEPVRRPSPLRPRPGSIFGLDDVPPEPERNAPE